MSFFKNFFEAARSEDVATVEANCRVCGDVVVVHPTDDPHKPGFVHCNTCGTCTGPSAPVPAGSEEESA